MKLRAGCELTHHATRNPRAVPAVVQRDAFVAFWESAKKRSTSRHAIQSDGVTDYLGREPMARWATGDFMLAALFCARRTTRSRHHDDASM
jgi:hypothetical protein